MALVEAGHTIAKVTHKVCDDQGTVLRVDRLEAEGFVDDLAVKPKSGHNRTALRGPGNFSEGSTAEGTRMFAIDVALNCANDRY